ncbi:MAG TPA: hypothetical protein VN962_16050, partial [Polyangia bacterium]|nr:hypothetical protein [Polyangia bacterium]
PPEPQFSDLIDRWLQEGDRLNEQAAAAPAPAAPATELERWRHRALELGRTVLERHRLELLVAVGLLPLMLFLITQGGGHRAPAVARRVPAAAPRPTGAPIPPVPRLAAPAPTPPAATALLSEGLLRQCTTGPRAAPPRRSAVHRHKPAVRPVAQAAPPPKGNTPVVRPAPRPPAPSKGNTPVVRPAPLAAAPAKSNHKPPPPPLAPLPPPPRRR